MVVKGFQFTTQSLMLPESEAYRNQENSQKTFIHNNILVSNLLHEPIYK